MLKKKTNINDGTLSHMDKPDPFKIRVRVPIKPIIVAISMVASPAVESREGVK